MMLINTTKKLSHFVSLFIVKLETLSKHSIKAVQILIKTLSNLSVFLLNNISYRMQYFFLIRTETISIRKAAKLIDSPTKNI